MKYICCCEMLHKLAFLMFNYTWTELRIFYCLWAIVGTFLGIFLSGLVQLLTCMMENYLTNLMQSFFLFADAVPIKDLSWFLCSAAVQIKSLHNILSCEFFFFAFHCFVTHWKPLWIPLCNTIRKIDVFCHDNLLPVKNSRILWESNYVT